MPISLPPELREALLQHARQAYPLEACGLIVEGVTGPEYVRCTNAAASPAEEFRIPPADWLAAELKGRVLAVFHSHPDASYTPSAADLAAMPSTGVPWVIMELPGGQVSVTEPKPLPLLGRTFVHGYSDCFTLLRDYYRQELNVVLPDVWHAYDWWAEGGNLYLEHAGPAGFSKVQDLQPHDVVLMTIASKVPNHVGVYIGDGMILHHLPKQLSRRDTYTGIWQRATYGFYRHSSAGARTPARPSS